MTVKEMKKQISELKNTNRMYRRVINDIISDSTEYSGNYIERLESRCKDVSHGCSTGIVTSLIYYSDTTAFFKRYRKEIETLLNDLCIECGCAPWELLRDFDRDDLFCRDTHNQNLLAWFAYEEVNNSLYNVLEA